MKKLEQKLELRDDFFFIRKKIYKDYGFDLSAYEQNFVRRRIEARMRELKADSLQQYYRMLDKEEFKSLLSALAVNESRFFRDASVYEEFSKILSSLIKEKRKTKDALRIWSAGCSAGEEPYSIAILLKEKEKEINFPFSIIATDIDEDALEKARKAEYGERSLFETKEEYMKYFKNDKEKYFLSEEIKNMVSFLHHDMIKNSISSCFDVIFYRNVLIYFSKEIRNKMFGLFYKNLKTMAFL